MSEQQTQEYEIREKMANLEQALLTKSPELPGLLRTIHAHLSKDPELVTILTEEECNILVEGLKLQTKTSIAETAMKKKGKSMKNLELGIDL